MPMHLKRPEPKCPGPECPGCESAACMSREGCPGPECPGCSDRNCMAKGGMIKGVHTSSDDEGDKDETGYSPAGAYTRGMRSAGSPESKNFWKQSAKAEHRRVLGEMKDMPKPKLMAEGGRLDANARAHIAKKNFAGPDRSYPIEDKAHARNALARVAQNGSPELQARVRSKVHAKYPDIGEHADGGMLNAEDRDDDGDHDMLDDGLTEALGQELCEAFEAKDKKRIMEGLEAVVLSVLARGMVG